MFNETSKVFLSPNKHLQVKSTLSPQSNCSTLADFLHLSNIRQVICGNVTKAGVIFIHQNLRYVDTVCNKETFDMMTSHSEEL